MLILLGFIVVFLVLVVLVFQRNFRREQHRFEQRIQMMRQTIVDYNLQNQRQKIKLELCDDFKDEFSKRRITLGESIFALNHQMLELISQKKA
jgi:hypothetical protein